MALREPDWLNVEFMEKVLKKSENDDSIEVKDVSMKPATAKGDNYTSDMIRVSVEYSRNVSGCKITEKKSLIVKISPMGIQKEMENFSFIPAKMDLPKIAKVGLFDTEIKMMETTLNKMNDMLNEEDYRLSARILYTEIGDPSLLVIEDLAPLGFRMADRQAGLDLHHCKLAIKGLAKFHASSLALVEKDPKLTNTYKKGMFHTEHPEDITKFFSDGLKNMANEILNNWSELEPIYAEKIEKLSGFSYSKAAECAKPSSDEFHVINHGDFWVNNMLFRYNDEGKVTDHIFVDFQLCVWTSPVIDILYFFNTSISDDVHLNHRDALLELYLNTLKETMLKLGCKTQPPSIAALKKSMKEREFYGVLSACTILPLVLIDKSEAKSLDEMMDEEGGFENPGYKGPLYRKTMLRRLPEWNARGLLDV